MTMDEAMDESKNRWSKGGRKSRWEKDVQEMVRK